MRISMLTAGSRGDTQPMTVLGAELRRRGHEVRIAASPNTLDLPRACGFEALPLGPDSQALMESEEGQRWLSAGNVRAFMNELSQITKANAEEIEANVRDACDSADALVAGLLAEDYAYAFAESQGIPLVLLHSAPYRTSSAYPHPLVTARQLPGPLNRLTGALFDRVWWGGNKDQSEAMRTRLGLPKAGGSIARRNARLGGLEIQAYDSQLVPRIPEDPRRPRVGFLTVDEEQRAQIGEAGVAPDLDAWLAAGDPPVSFGFGSMPVRDPAAVVGMITGVSRALGVRALVSAGWGGLAALEPDDPDVTVVRGFNHDLVLPRCRAAVHHGGAGTTAASLGAGIPTVVCSVFADQPFWGARVVEQGVGASLRFQDLSRETLEDAVRTAIAPETAARAQALGDRLRSPHSAAIRAADAFEARVAVG